MDERAILNLRDLQLVALHDVQSEPEDYVVRKVCRWYSRTFFTPLEQVYDIPLEEVFRTYWEVRFEEMDEREMEKVKSTLLESDEARKARRKAEDTAEAEAADYARIVEAEEKRKKEDSANKRLEDVEKSTQLPMSILQPAKASELPPPKMAPPDIKMTFISEEEMEKEIEGFGLLGPPPKRGQQSR